MTVADGEEIREMLVFSATNIKYPVIVCLLVIFFQVINPVYVSDHFKHRNIFFNFLCFAGEGEKVYERGISEGGIFREGIIRWGEFFMDRISWSGEFSER